MNSTIEISRLVTHPREQYLRQNEARLRSLSLPARNDDPVVAVHTNAMLFAEDLIDRHEVAAEANRQHPTRQHVALEHQVFAAKATQLKLYHLDQLANLLI